MIMARNADGSYEEITAIKTKTGENISEIIGRDGSVYFISVVNAVVEGYPCVLQNSVGKSAVNYSIYGNSTQNGTPSPNNPVEVQNVGELVTEDEYAGKYKIPVVTRGKNLWRNDYSQFDDIGGVGSTYKYFYVGAGHIISATAKNDVTVQGDKYIGISTNGGDYRKGYTWLLSPNKKMKKGQTISLVITDLCPFVSIYTKDQSTFNFFIENFDIQIDRGSTATSYEPYKVPATTNIYLDEPLKTGEILKFPKNVLVHADGTEESVTLPKIPTFKGTTVITTDTEIQPSDMEITYKLRR